MYYFAQAFEKVLSLDRHRLDRLSKESWKLQDLRHAEGMHRQGRNHRA